MLPENTAATTAEPLALDADDILAELGYLGRLLEEAANARELASPALAESGFWREELADSAPRPRYRVLGSSLARVAAAGVATFPAVLMPMPSFAHETLPQNLMLSMAERPPAPAAAGEHGATVLGSTGAAAGAAGSRGLFPFSRPMLAMTERAVAASPRIHQLKMPLSPKLKVTLQQARVTVTTKHHAASTFYQVSHGDSLYSIAADMLGAGSRWREIYALNRHKVGAGYGVQPGQRLVIPLRRHLADVRTAHLPGGQPVNSPTQSLAGLPAGSTHLAAHQARPAAHHPHPRTASVRYHVTTGDSLYVIAAKRLKNPQRWREILAMNKAVLQGRTVIYPNQWLVIPTNT